MSNSRPLVWRTSVTSMPGRKLKSCAGDQAHVGHLRRHQRLVIQPGLLGMAGDHRHRRARLVAHQLLQHLGQKLAGLARRGEPERFHRGAAARGHRPHVPLQRPQHVLRDLDDLPGRAVADPQRLDPVVGDAQVVQHVRPGGEAVVGRDGLGGVARQGDRAFLGGAVQQHRQLHRGEVLHLVHHQVLVGHRPPLASPAPHAAAGRPAAAGHRPPRPARRDRCRPGRPCRPVRMRSRSLHQRTSRPAGRA